MAYRLTIPSALEPAPLIDRIYAAAVHPEEWGGFVVELSEALDSAAVLLTLSAPGEAPRYHAARLTDGFLETHAEFLVKGLPWTLSRAGSFVEEFGDGRETFPDIDLRETEFYTGWMRPQKLAPVWPVGLTLTTKQGFPVGGLSIFRPEPGRPFAAADLRFGDLLVPHLKRGFTLANAVGAVERARLALVGVVDRLPTGVILLDEHRRPVVTNTSADHIVALNDGFNLSPGGPWLASSRENARLQQLLADALEVTAGQELQTTGFMVVSRASRCARWFSQNQLGHQ